MFTRVFLNITKHKVLNILLVLLFILSFVGVAFSSVFVYKTNTFLNKIEAEDDYIIMTPEDLESGVYDSQFIDATPYFEAYNNTIKDNKNIDTFVSMDTFLVVIDEFQDFNEFIEESESYKTVSITYLEEEAKDYFDTDDFDSSKVYIQQNLADKYNISVGDKVTLATIDEENMFQFGSDEYTSTKEIEIDEIAEAVPAGGGADETGMVYLPFDELNGLNIQDIKPNWLTIRVSGTTEEVAKVYEEIKEYSNDANIYYSAMYESKDLDFFVKIQRFFTVILISTIAILALAFLSLNSNIMERRNDEFRLYNIFGLKSGKILSQIIIERVVLFTFSLLIAIPLFLSMIRTGNTIVDNLVQYSLENDMVLSTLAYSSGNDKLVDLLYNGITAMDVSNILIILFTIIIVLLTIILITIVQFTLNNKRIVNQRRGE